MSKASTEDDLEGVRAEVQTTKIANDEYRRVLRAKNSELAKLKRDSDALAKLQSVKIKEFELAASHDARRL